ncbi:XkdQ/YqbQ family protein [Fusibacter ferrireducens]|uniref:YqbQ/XkdQ domain-containing protein n=1 Tax=Fusibacter ferrireducens TaxID=2785058 RepID=A0ABR9ZTW4_9FIRM|nr:hypothetical protein [Fusibacter ferrireducens]MBF4693899.1 hypothetical protein [Fusibacter ferrireducens]
MKMIVVKNKKTFDISDLIQNLSWGGSINQVARKLTFQMIYGSDYYTPKFVVSNGDFIKLLDQNDQLILSGVIFSKETDRAGGTISVTVYDPLIYLTKNLTTKVAKKVAVTHFIKSLCDEFEIEIVRMPDISTTIDGIFRDVSVYDLIKKALVECSKLNDIQYVMRYEGNGIAIDALGTHVNTMDLVSGEDEIYTLNISESMEELRNTVVIRGKGDGVLVTVKDDELIKKYGRMQHQSSEEKMTKAQSQIYATKLLKELGQETLELSIQMKGNTKIKAGDLVNFKDEELRLNQSFVIEEDNHSMNNSDYTMDLKLMRR